MNITKRIGRSGKISYRVLIRKKGYQPVSETFPTKAKAEQWARKTEAEMDQRVFNPHTKETVWDLFERYRIEVSPKKRGYRWENVRIKRLQKVFFAKFRVHEVTTQILQQWRNKRQTEVAPNTVIRELTMMSAIFNHAISEWHLPILANPATKVKRPPAPKHRTRRVAEDEIKKIREQFNDAINYLRDYTPWVFEFCIETGLRMSEACRLRWIDVNFDERWIYVLPSKNGDDRYVPLTDGAVALLATVRMLGRKEECVFPVQVGSLGTEFREACKKAGIIDLHFHDSRHEACSRLAKTYTVMELAKIIGHRDLKSLMIYYNPTPAELASKLGTAQSKPQHPQPPTIAFGPDGQVSVVEAPGT